MIYEYTHPLSSEKMLIVKRNVGEHLTSLYQVYLREYIGKWRDANQTGDGGPYYHENFNFAIKKMERNHGVTKYGNDWKVVNKDKFFTTVMETEF